MERRVGYVSSDGSNFVTKEEWLAHETAKLEERVKTAERVSYRSEDGQIFNTESDCLKHEEIVRAEKAIEDAFNEHFTEVFGISDDLQNFVTRQCENSVYSFIGFEGWRDIANNYLKVDEIYEDDKVEIGKKYYIFADDDGWAASVVSYEGLKARMLEDLEALKA